MISRPSRSPSRRRGAIMVESSIIMSVLFMMAIGAVIFGMGTFRYQQLASLAREGARYASVHGASYAKDTGQAKTSAAGVYANAILPMAVALDPSCITYSVTWDNPAQTPIYQVNATTNTYLVNYVNVTVNYSWQVDSFPGFSATTITLTSTSRMPMAN